MSILWYLWQNPFFRRAIMWVLVFILACIIGYILFVGILMAISHFDNRPPKFPIPPVKKDIHDLR
jgi:hypothetical protein